jgi:hypothetical protein
VFYAGEGCLWEEWLMGEKVKRVRKGFEFQRQ